MNAAFLMLTAWAAASHGCTSPAPCPTPTPTCAKSACADDCCGKESWLDRIKARLHRKSCDTCQVTCAQPGPIPGTECPTCKQKLIDRLFPNRCCPKSRCECAPPAPRCHERCKDAWPCPRPVRCEKPSCGRVCGDPCPKATCSSCDSCGERKGLLNRLFGGLFSRKCDSCNTCGGEVIITPAPGGEKMKMPKATDGKDSSSPQKLPTGMNTIERIEIQPVSSYRAMPVGHGGTQTITIVPEGN